MDAFHLAVHVADRERLALVQPGKAEAQCRAAVGEAGIVMDVDAVAGSLAVAVDLEDAPVEVGLLDVGSAVGRGALPTVTDSLHPVAFQLSVKFVLKDQHTLLLKPNRVVARSG